VSQNCTFSGRLVDSQINAAWACKAENIAYGTSCMRNLRDIEQVLLKLSSEEAKEMLAWIDRHLEDKPKRPDTLNLAIQQPKRAISDNRPRARQG
jgi:hypothetical protein